MVLDKDDFVEVLDLYPQMRRALTRYARQKSKVMTARSEALKGWEQYHKVKLEQERACQMRGGRAAILGARGVPY